MTRSISATAAMLMAMTMLMFASAQSRGAEDDKEWKVLGEVKIERKSGNSQIDVAGAEGLVRQIKFEVRGAEVEFKKVAITYEKGDPEEIDIRDSVRRGGRTREINLKGGNRAIKRVVITFKVDKDADRDALIVLLGKK